MKYAILAGAAYLLFIGSIMKTEGLRSALVFKTLPIGLAFGLAYAGIVCEVAAGLIALWTM